MWFTFLQDVTTTAPVAVTTEKVSFFAMLMKGGWVMAPLFLLFFSAIFLFVYKLLYIQRTGKVDPGLINQVTHALSKGDLEGAKVACRGQNTHIAHVLDRGLSRLGSPIQEIESGMSSAAKAGVSAMEKHMSLLGAITTLAPMFGFLGTVLGMIAVFSQIANSNDNLSISNISEGMYVKMVTAASGLVTGILAYVFHTFLNSQIDASISKMEDASNTFLDTLYKPHV